MSTPGAVARRGSELPFPPAVLAARMRRVQARLRADRLAGALLFDPENIYYLTGFQSLGYFTYQTLLLPAAGRPTLVSRRVNQYLARVTPSLGGFVAIEDTADPVAVTVAALRRLPRGRLGLETAAWYLTAETYERLRRDAGRELVPWSGVVEGERIVKSPDELARIREAARAAEAGLAAAVDVLAPGISENDVAAAMHRASIAAGSEYLGHAPLVASGERSGLCFATWRRRRLKRGDVVFLEAAGCVDRYHAILARTAVLGRASRPVRRIADTLRRALDAALSTIRPGIAAGAVDRACRSILERAGLGRRSRIEPATRSASAFPELERRQDPRAAPRRADAPPARHDVPRRAHGLRRGDRRVPQRDGRGDRARRRGDHAIPAGPHHRLRVAPSMASPAFTRRVYR